MARLFKKIARTTDTVGRFGGEEFCFVAPQLHIENAQKFAGRLIKEVEDHDFPNMKVTLSGGVATYPADATSIEALLEIADKRLYIAKNRGKNQICCSSGTEVTDDKGK
jgi:diguanylate cyclase (GGDEF)-like protein